MNIEKQLVDIVKQLLEEKRLGDKRAEQLFNSIVGHGSNHHSGGDDEVDHDLLKNFAANEHFLQSAITVVGTIVTGVWNGTPLTAKYYIPYQDDDSIGSAFNSTTVGSYVTTGVQIPYTPAFDCKVLVSVFFIAKRSTTGNYMLGALYEATDADTLGVAYYHPMTANEYKQHCIIGCKDLTASTAYTFQLRMYQSAAGTMTVAQSPYVDMNLLAFGR